MKNLTLVPLGGLCNRLRALLSARSLVDHDHELRVRVVWDVNRDCAARYGELFEDHFTPPGNSYLASRDGSMHRRCGDTTCDCPPCVAHLCTVHNGLIFIRIGRQGSAWRILKNGDASISLRGCSCVKPHRKSGEDCDLFHRFESGSTRCASAWASTTWGYIFDEQTT